MTLIFDYDGTIHDTAKLYGTAVREVYAWLVDKGYAEPKSFSDSDLNIYLGMTAAEMWNSFMPDLPDDLKKCAAKRVGDNMLFGINQGNAKLYDGITDLLDNITSSGYRCVILSNCDIRYMNAHRACFSLDKWFDDYFTSEGCGGLSKQDIVPLIKRKYPDNQYIIIGDRSSDIMAAKGNGIPSIGCAYGFGSLSELSECTKIVYSAAEIKQAITI